VKYTIALALAVIVVSALGFERWRDSAPGRGPWLRLAAANLLFAAACLLGSMYLKEAPVVASWTADHAGAADGLAVPIDALVRAAAVGGAAALVFFLRSRRPSPERWLSGALLALVLVDLVSAGMGVNRLAPAALVSYRPPIADRLSEEGARIYVAMWPLECSELARGPQGWEVSWVRSLGSQQAILPPVGVRWGIYGSYDGEFTGLGTPLTGELSGAMREGEASPTGSALLRLGAVDYVVAVIGAQDRLRLATASELPTVYACPLRLLQVDGTLPRVSVVDGVRAEPPSGALAALLDPEFDPRRSVLLSVPAREKSPSSSFQASARIVGRGTDRLEIQTEANAPGHLVVREAFAPGWRAFVNGRPTPTLRGNGLFRAVEVPAGSHRVTMRYRPPLALAGLVVSLAGVLVAVALGIRGLRPVAGPPTGG
jgi:hypothetical protein